MTAHEIDRKNLSEDACEGIQDQLFPFCRLSEFLVKKKRNTEKLIN